VCRTGRQYTYALRAGHKAAHLVTETTNYEYMTSLDVPKKWFAASIDAILRAYGDEHRLQKEDVFLGAALRLCGCGGGLTRSAQSSASSIHLTMPSTSATRTRTARSVHTPPSCTVRDLNAPQLHFNVFSAPRPNGPWGEFLTDAAHQAGPNYMELPTGPTINASKVSETKRAGPWDSVLLARLRFKPDVLEPTSQ
jgi:abelson tyrosine-protein kinase 1